ncbi:hypothetical protein SCP_1800180 [Sparassis crispa]|uniref:Uncharacterized protein n=1 Tax=Sparassis crispa TaxID=139825 RepID=A0A401H6C3_9APHY|nr:hypothetical protein SCP_1800180 [Sparassis crispa]GBE89996.1 hypothetical protein SCP_1800180 [Sparassis crispa]
MAGSLALLVEAEQSGLLQPTSDRPELTARAHTPGGRLSDHSGLTASIRRPGGRLSRSAGERHVLGKRSSFTLSWGRALVPSDGFCRIESVTYMEASFASTKCSSHVA